MLLNDPSAAQPEFDDSSETATPQGSTSTDRPLPGWSQSLQTVLDQPPASLPSRMIGVGLAFCCIFAAWAWFGKVQDISQGTGQLVPQGRVYKVQPAGQGEIVRLLVKEGDQVKAGQVVAELDGRLLEAEVHRLQQSLSAYRLQLIQSQELLHRTALEAEMRQAIAQSQAQSQSAALTEAQVAAATQQELLKQTETDQAASEARLTRLRPLVNVGAIAQEQLFEVEQSLRDRQRSQIQSEGDLQRAIANAKRYQAEFAQQQAEVQRSHLEKQQRLQQIQVGISELEASIQETQNLLSAAQTQLQSKILTAPITGTVLALHIDNVGEVAQPGQTIAEIAPIDAPLVLSTVIPNDRAGLIQLGMAAQIKIDAFPYQEYGVLSGKVLSVSPDAKEDQQLGPVYEVEIFLDRATIYHQNRVIPLRAGQTATVEIVLRQRRILEVLLDPFQKLRKDSLKL
ncbi:HlyD family type I secretion periplasmic adaptor subunit [Thermoleptolyngbya sp.]